MKIKVKEVLRKNNGRSSNRDVMHEIRRVLKNSDEKFYWLDFGVLVYNDIWGYDNHHVWGGYRVDVFHEYGRNVIVFYRYKNQSPAGYVSGSVRSAFSRCGSMTTTWGGTGGCWIETPSRSAYDAFVKIKRYNGLWFIFDSSFHEKYVNEATWTLMLLPKDT